MSQQPMRPIIDPRTGLPIPGTGFPGDPGIDPTMGMGTPPPAAQPGFMSKIQSALGGPQGMMNMGASLLAGSGPSPVRQNLGSILGQSLLQNQQFQQQSSDSELKKMLLMSQIERNNRGTATKTPSKVQEYEYAKQNGYKGSFDEWMRIASAQQTSPAGIQEYEYFNKLDPEGKKEFLALQRSPVVPQIAMVNGVPTLVDRTGNTAPNPLSSQESELEAARRMAETKASATAEGKITGARAGKAPTAYAAYQAGIGSLEKAMSGTATGPVAGRIPAVTAGQQIAEGAEATMAPILKQLFRDSGEGTFTDADQALLMKMVPTRKDHEEARKAKIGMIDEIVRAKLAISAPAGAAPKRVKVDAKGNPL
jgi:hypothetical protein